MITRIVKMKFKLDQVSTFLAIFESSHQKIRNSNGCYDLRLVRGIDDEGIFFTVSKWESEEHLSSYRNSELFAKTWSETKILFSERAEAWSTVEQIF